MKRRETGPEILKKNQYDNIRIIAASTQWDLALLKIDGEDIPQFHTVPIGNMDNLKQGQVVFAIGNPLGLERSVSQGIVSIPNRLINGRLFIQSTAQINPGNSGGPLFNLKGEVVGVNNMKIVSQGAEGLGFAVPSGVLKSFLKNRDAFAFDPRNPNNGYRYNSPPSRFMGKEEQWKFKICMIVVLISVMAFTVHAAPRRFETGVPDNTMFCISVDNMKTFYKKWRQHPVSDIAKKDSVNRLLDLWLKDAEPDDGPDDAPGKPEKSLSRAMEEELGIKLERLPELFPGQWMIAVGEFDFAKYLDDADTGAATPDIPYVELMRHNGDVKTIRSIIDASARYDSKNEGTTHRIIEKSFQGTTLLIEEVTDSGQITVAGGYALVDDVLVMTFSEEMLKETVIRLKNKSNDSFYGSKRFARVRDRVADKDAYVFAHFEKMVQVLQAGAIKAFEEKAAEKNAENQSSPISMFSPEMLFTALNLTAFDGFFCGLTLDEERSDFTSGLILNERNGLASLLQYEKGPLPHPAYIPSDVPGAGINHFNLSAFFINLENLVIQAVPVAGGMYQGYLAQIKSQSGIDVREGLISNLGSEMVTVDLNQTRQSPDQSGINPIEKVYAIKIKDRQSFEMAINGILSAFGGADRFEKSDYLGYAVYRLKPLTAGASPAKSNAFAYTITNDTFLFSVNSVEGVKTILSRMKKPSSKTLWDTKTVQRAVKALPAGNVNFKYVDVNTITRALINTLVMFKDEAALKESGVNLEVLKKDMDFPYCLISQTYSEEDGIYNRAMLLKKEK